MQRIHWKEKFFHKFRVSAKDNLRIAFVGALVFLTLLYSISNILIRRELLEDNLLKSKIVEKNMYIAFEQLNNILKSGEQLVSENNKILDQNFSEIPVEDLIHIIDEIKNLKVYNPFIQEMLLFQKDEPDYITSQGIISSEKFFNYDYTDTDYNREYFENIFYDYNAPTVLPLREFNQVFNYNGEGVLRIFIVPKIYKVFHTGILLLINEQKFIEFCAITDEQIKMQVSLYNHEGSLVISNSMNDVGTRLDIGKLENNAQSVKNSFWGHFQYMKWFDYENMIFSVETSYYTGMVLLIFYLLLIGGATLVFLVLQKRLKAEEQALQLAGEELGTQEESLSVGMLPAQIAKLKKNIIRMNENTAVLKKAAFSAFLKGTEERDTAQDYLEDILQADCFGMFCAVRRGEYPENQIEQFLNCQGFSSLVISEGGHKFFGLIPFYHMKEEKAAVPFSEMLHRLEERTEEGLVLLYSRIFTNFSLSKSIYQQLNASLDQVCIRERLVSLEQLRPVDLHAMPGNISGELSKLLSAGDRKAVKKYFETQLEETIEENPSYYKLFYLVQYFDTVFMELVYKITKNNEEIEGIQKLFLQSLKRYSAELDADGVCNSFYNMVYLVMEKLQDESHAKDIGEILKYINRNYKGELYLDKVATHFNMKPKYFSYYFKREYEMGFNEYLTQLRIEEAKQLLKNSVLSIGEISQQVGYQNQVTFNAAFKKYTGISPTSYRKEG